MRTSYLASTFYQVDAFYDEIQNAAYSYSDYWRSRDAIDEEDDATFAWLVQTEEALSGSKKGFTGRIGVDCCASEHLSTFHNCTFFTRLFTIKNAF
jgi:hypothetical protein